MYSLYMFIYSRLHASGTIMLRKCFHRHTDVSTHLTMTHVHKYTRVCMDIFGKPLIITVTIPAT